MGINWQAMWDMVGYPLIATVVLFVAVGAAAMGIGKLFKR